MSETLNSISNILHKANWDFQFPKWFKDFFEKSGMRISKYS
jgi:hypothetical protein